VAALTRIFAALNATALNGTVAAEH